MVGIISSGKVSGSPVENEIIELDSEKISAAFGPRFFLISGRVSDLMGIVGLTRLRKKSGFAVQPLKGRLNRGGLRHR
jgi:hypothetical protein